VRMRLTVQSPLYRECARAFRRGVVSVAVNAGTIGKFKAQNGLSVYLACTGEAILLLVIRRDRCPMNAVAG
jgi:hypothetical protein